MTSSFIVYTFPLAKRRSKINIEETFEDIENIDNIGSKWIIYWREKPWREKLVIPEEEIAGLGTIKETNVKDLSRIIFVDEKRGNMTAVVHEGGSTGNKKSDIILGELHTYRSLFCGKCYTHELFYKKHVEYYFFWIYSSFNILLWAKIDLILVLIIFTVNFNVLGLPVAFYSLDYKFFCPEFFGLDYKQRSGQYKG